MTRMLTLRTCAMALAGLIGLLPMAACSGKQESAQTTPRETTASAEPAQRAAAEPGEPVTPPAPPPEAGAKSEEPPAQAEAAPPSPTPKPEAPAASSDPKSTPTPPAAAPSQTSPQVTEPEPSPAGEVVAVPATKSGLTRVGAEKCKLCHRVEYESWAATAHAARKPPLDCESCHGPGSEYKTVSIMKDPEKARAAGLVIPEKSFCTESCHTKKWQDDMLKRVHAHKAKTTQG